MRWLLAAILLLPAVAASAQTGTPGDIDQKDWSFQAMKDLAARGIVHGYRDARFLEVKKVSRFEMAALVKRVMDAILEIPDPAKLRKESEKPGTAAARGQGLEPLPSGNPRISEEGRARVAALTENDLGTVKRLADEFSVELAVLGAPMQSFQERIEGLEGRVETIESSLQDPEGSLQTVISNVARIDKIRFSGYLQARYQAFEHENENNPPGPQRDVVNTFSIRRARLNISFRPSEKISGRFSTDLGGSGNANTRDAYVAYHFTGNPATGHTVTFGQMNIPFGFEVSQSSSVRESPERSRIAQFYFRDERDRGVKLSSGTADKFFYELGVFNGVTAARPGRNADDNNEDKTVIGRVRTTLLNNRLDLGVSAMIGTGAQGPSSSTGLVSENKQNAFGLDLQFFPFDGTTVRFEGVWGKSLGQNVWGWYAYLIQNIGSKWQAVAKYDWIGADGPVAAFPINNAGVTGPSQYQAYSGTASNLSLGVIYFLDPSTRLKLFYEIHKLGREDLVSAGFHGDIVRLEVVTVF